MTVAVNRNPAGGPCCANLEQRQADVLAADLKLQRASMGVTQRYIEDLRRRADEAEERLLRETYHQEHLEAAVRAVALRDYLEDHRPLNWSEMGSSARDLWEERTTRSFEKQVAS